MNYSEGDLVEAVKGDAVIRDRVALAHDHVYDRLYLPSMHAHPDLANLKGMGYTVTVIEKAAPKIELPTEFGAYLDDRGRIWHVTGDGELLCALHGNKCGSWEERTDYTFTKLEPVPVAAKKVLEAIEERYGEDFFRNKNDGWNDVAKAFGVTT